MSGLLQSNSAFRSFTNSMNWCGCMCVCMFVSMCARVHVRPHANRPNQQRQHFCFLKEVFITASPTLFNHCVYYGKPNQTKAIKTRNRIHRLPSTTTCYMSLCLLSVPFPSGRVCEPDQQDQPAIMSTYYSLY